MKDNINYKALGRGLYRAAFSLCIILLCVITVVITGNYDNESSTDTEADYASSINDSDAYVATDNFEQPEQQGSGLYSESDAISEPHTQSETENLQPDFIPPIEGDVQKSFSAEIPLYSKTMDDWRIHLGVDISSPYGTPVVSVENGKVEKIGYDISFGNYIEISCGDFLCIYMSLESDIIFKEGDYVEKGSVVGYLSDSCISEICDEPHLHFEMKKNGEHVNPEEYIY